MRLTLQLCLLLTLKPVVAHLLYDFNYPDRLIHSIQRKIFEAESLALFYYLPAGTRHGHAHKHSTWHTPTAMLTNIQLGTFYHSKKLYSTSFCSWTQHYLCVCLNNKE